MCLNYNVPVPPLALSTLHHTSQLHYTYTTMDPTPGSSSQPMDVDDPSDTPPGNGDATPQSPPSTAESSTADKGKGKEVDW